MPVFDPAFALPARRLLRISTHGAKGASPFDGPKSSGELTYPTSDVRTTPVRRCGKPIP
jgi:hypothetical protein